MKRPFYLITTPQHKPMTVFQDLRDELIDSYIPFTKFTLDGESFYKVETTPDYPKGLESDLLNIASQFETTLLSTDTDANWIGELIEDDWINEQPFEMGRDEKRGYRK